MSPLTDPHKLPFCPLTQLWLLVHRPRHDLDGHRALAYGHLKLCTRFVQPCSHPPHPHILVQGRPEGPARHLANDFAILRDRVVRARHAPTDHFKVDHALAAAVLRDAAQGVHPYAVNVLVKLDEAPKACPDGIAIRGRRHVTARKWQAGLQPKRVTTAEAARLGAVLHEELPESHRLLYREEELEAVLARIAGARYAGWHAVNAAGSRPVELERRQVHVRELLHESGRAGALNVQLARCVGHVLKVNVETKA